MAIVNRTLDPSQQKYELTKSYGLWGTTLVPLFREIGPVASPSTIVGARIAAFGVSGSPVLTLRIRRFITGAGSTIFTGGFTGLALVSVGTSGIQSVVCAASGSTALQLQAGDVIDANMSDVAEAAVSAVSISVVLQATQDIKTHYGL